MTVVALEGLPGTGKTSLLQHFQHDPSLNIIAIGEHVFPEHLFELNTSINNDSESIYELQWEAKDALCHLFQGNTIVDRSYVTCLAYNYAKAKVQKEPDIYARVCQWMEVGRQRGILHPLDLCIVLSIDPIECNHRKHRVETADILWSSLAALEYNGEFYHKVLPHLGNIAKHFEFVDTNRPFEDVKQNVSRILYDALR